MPRYRVGTSGYNYPEWKGSFYPEKWPQKKMCCIKVAPSEVRVYKGKGVWKQPPGNQVGMKVKSQRLRSKDNVIKPKTDRVQSNTHAHQFVQLVRSAK